MGVRRSFWRLRGRWLFDSGGSIHKAMYRADYFAGLDLGQSQDPTALVVVERAELRGEWDAAAYGYRKETALRLRYLERMPLGTPYPEVVERVREAMGSPALEGRCRLAVDATGVGRPVVDLLRRGRLGCSLWPVMITGGDVEGTGDGYYRVPKRDLIVGLQVLLQSGGLQIASGLSDGATLMKEMMGMKVKVSNSGHERYGAWREREHDDLGSAQELLRIGRSNGVVPLREDFVSGDAEFPQPLGRGLDF